MQAQNDFFAQVRYAAAKLEEGAGRDYPMDKIVAYIANRQGVSKERAVELVKYVAVFDLLRRTVG